MLEPKKKLETLTQAVLPEEFSAVWVESVMAKLPLHTLSTQGQMQVRLEKRDESGEITLLWEVSPSREFGEPRQLAYRLDTLLINKRLDEAGAPTPKIIRLGSMRSICRELGLSESGHNFNDIRQSLSQNAGAALRAKLHYRDREGQQRKLEAVFTRYSVVFTGDSLPDGEEADGVYVVMNDIYQGFLNHVPRRPLDFAYLRQLTPSACRFYEVVSFRIYSALKYGWPRVSLAYSEYCEVTGQRRLLTGTEVSKQMYKLHKPHLDSGYLTKAVFEKTTDATGQPDWNIWYAPGPRAKDEYVRFSAKREAASETRTGSTTPVPALLPAVMPAVMDDKKHLLPLSPTAAETLIAHFQQLRFGKAVRSIAAKEIALAEGLLQRYEAEPARQLVAEALRAALNAGVKPIWMTELKGYLELPQTNGAEN